MDMVDSLVMGVGYIMLAVGLAVLYCVYTDRAANMTDVTPRGNLGIDDSLIRIYRHIGRYWVEVIIPQCTLDDIAERERPPEIFGCPLSDNWGRHGWIDTGFLSHHPEARMMDRNFTSRDAAEEAYFQAEAVLVGHPVLQRRLVISEAEMSPM